MASAKSLHRVLCALETSLDPHTVLRKSGVAYCSAPVSARFGGGAAHHHHQSLSPYGQEQEQASNQTRRVRAKGLCAHGRSSTQGVHHGRARLSGCAHRDPVRPQARLLSSLNAGEMERDRTPPLVSTCHRPPGPAYERRSSTLCPCRVFSLSAPDTFGPQDWPAKRAQRLPRRPM
jgi:hypothetical protein